MSLPGNPEIQEMIEHGKGAVKTYTFTSKKKEMSLQWSPTSYTVSRIVFFEAVSKCPTEYRQWLTSPKAKRFTKNDEGEEIPWDRPPTEIILQFNYYHAVYHIHAAVRSHYPGITVQQIEDLDVDFDDFHTQIATASGIMGGQETVQSFPANERTQDTETET